MIITILVDDMKSWFIPHARKLVSLLEKEHDVTLIHDYQNLRHGDCAFFLSCVKIVPAEFLKLNRHNIAVHPSDLPKGRGWSPLTWQILQGKNKIPIVLFEAVKEMDRGKIYFRDFLEFEGHELNDELKQKQGEKVMELVLKFIKSQGNAKGTKQKGKPTFYRRRTKEDCELSINKTIREQFNSLRIGDNERYPSSFRYKGHKYILKIYKEKDGGM